MRGIGEILHFLSRKVYCYSQFAILGDLQRLVPLARLVVSFRPVANTVSPRFIVKESKDGDAFAKALLVVLRLSGY